MNKEVITYDAEGKVLKKTSVEGKLLKRENKTSELKDIVEEIGSKIDDCCSVCDENLFFTSEVTKRIALLDDCEEVIGWICPGCYTQFDMDDNIQVLYSKNNIQGKT